jgi:hypothetical protein
MSVDDPLPTLAAQDCCYATWHLTPFRRSQIPVVIALSEPIVGMVPSSGSGQCGDAISLKDFVRLLRG